MSVTDTGTTTLLFRMAPPPVVAELPVNVDSYISSVPLVSLKMAPPLLVAELSVNLQTPTVRPPSL